MTNWTKLIEPYKDDLLKDLDGLLRIESVKDLTTASDRAPFGEKIQAALDYMLDLGRKDGFTDKDLDHYAGHLEIGQGHKLLGILCHLDVVPADANQWETDPFIPVIKDGKLFARGALDDKGPTIMAYYAIKILNELGLTWNKRIRLIFGTDEENDWQGVDYYFKHEEMPDFGIVPDGIFPMIYAEKGVFSFDFQKEIGLSSQLLSFKSGQTYNLVPDLARAELVYPEKIDLSFHDYLNEYGLSGSISQEGNKQILTLQGKSAHGAGPDQGINAGLHLARFLTSLELDRAALDFTHFVSYYLFGSSKGTQLGLDFYDKELGQVTVNPAVFSFENGRARVGINLRYPASYDFENNYKKLLDLAQQNGYSIKNVSHKQPSLANLDSPETQILLETYRKHTNDFTPPLAIGGITYGRVFDKGVTFGPAFLGKKATLHQPNEYIELEDLFKALEIYLDAIYQLATVEGASGKQLN
ncbi:succinyl-diaminopimelate desuccinylase [Streptococcus henryi]|uniref:Succinyl-diaminopimelate desuccinylase n=1 Tax=Streptococcus henryi TaxID=439219 RepID=A0A1G6B9A6_9STRE|nr:dipeptidase PepV [Streptococcus henryi]SDB17033.1 succinyl-diaminopimelate desuccinylase [Streptococcus henryi]